MSLPPGPVRLTCPACGRFLATLDGCTSFEPPPCSCGVQVVIRFVGRRFRPEMSEARLMPLETKSSLPS